MVVEKEQLQDHTLEFHAGIKTISFYSGRIIFSLITEAKSNKYVILKKLPEAGLFRICGILAFGTN